MTNDWWGLHAGDDFKAREKRRPKEVNMRKGVDLHACYVTTRDGVKVGYTSVQDTYKNKKQESWSRLDFLFENKFILRLS